MNIASLIKAARQVQTQAYAPYSGFKVGAALLTASGQIYLGANIENASYGLTVCAERIAVFQAVLAGERAFAALAVCGSGTGFVHPCGACLQVLAEFSPRIKIYCCDENDDYREYALKDLLPQVFALEYPQEASGIKE